MEQPKSEVVAHDTASDVQTPDVFLCPISKTLMYDPVVVVETGQVYDHVSIKHWFEAGNNTCPLTGVSLTSQKITRLPTLRSGIAQWAERHNICLSPPETLEPEHKGYGELDNPFQSLALVTSTGVSVYNPEAVVKLMTQQTVPETYAAMVVLKELLQHADEKQFNKISNLIDIDRLKQMLNDDGLKKPAARLLITLKGSLDMDELASLLVIPDIDLQVELMTRLVEHICQRHSTRHRRRSSRFSMPTLFRRPRRFSISSFSRRCLSFGR